MEQSAISRTNFPLHAVLPNQNAKTQINGNHNLLKRHITPSHKKLSQLPRAPDERAPTVQYPANQKAVDNSGQHT